MFRDWPTWEDILLKILPLEVYEEISYDMADIFSAAVHQYPPAQDAFGSMSLSDVQDFAKDNAIAARNYDPHAEVHEIQEFFARLYKLIETLLVTIIVVGILAGAGFWVTYSRGILDVLGAVSQVLLSVLLGGPALLAVPAGLVLLYVRILAFDSFAVQVLNPALAIGPAECNIRDKETVIGYGMWNSSLDGGAGLKLLVVFSALWILSAIIPRRDPYGFVKMAVTDNIGVFAHADGLIDATKRAYHRIQSRKERERERGPEREETAR